MATRSYFFVCFVHRTRRGWSGPLAFVHPPTRTESAVESTAAFRMATRSYFFVRSVHWTRRGWSGPLAFVHPPTRTESAVESTAALFRMATRSYFFVRSVHRTRKGVPGVYRATCGESEAPLINCPLFFVYTVKKSLRYSLQVMSDTVALQCSLHDPCYKGGSYSLHMRAMRGQA